MVKISLACHYHGNEMFLFPKMGRGEGLGLQSSLTHPTFQGSVLNVVFSGTENSKL